MGPTFENDVDLILPNLWLGNWRSAMNINFLKRYNIKYIVNVTTEIPCAFAGTGPGTGTRVRYYHLKINRKRCENNLSFSPQQMDLKIDQAADFIRNGLLQNKGVLVHCHKGHHRSASIVLAYLIKYHGTSFTKGIGYIQSHRPSTFTRPACMVDYVYRYIGYLLRLQ